jgi:hypothetical protein
MAFTLSSPSTAPLKYLIKFFPSSLSKSSREGNVEIIPPAMSIKFL